MAILPVVFFHAGAGMRGGFVGVDVFFVISGFLITSLCLKELRQGEFRLENFWERRVRRIFPPLFAMLLVSFAIAGVIFMPRDFTGFARSLLAQVEFISNVYFAGQGGYFAGPSEEMPLLHTWSLAVEEQFYFIYPFLLVTIFAASRLSLRWLFALLAALSFGFCVYGTSVAPRQAFYLLPWRAWELLLGALVCAVPLPAERWRGGREALAWASLAAIVVAIFSFSATTVFPGPWALLPCAGAALFIAANGPGLTGAGRLLTWRPIVFTGLISYSWYLWHWPVLVFGKYVSLAEPGALWRAAVILGSFGLGALSWRCLERPFRERRLLSSRAGLFGATLGAMAVLAAAAWLVVSAEGAPGRFPKKMQRYVKASQQQAPVSQQDEATVRARLFYPLGTPAAGRPTRLVLWGDSHSMALFPVLDEFCRTRGVQGVGITHSSTPPLLDFVTTARSGLGASAVPYAQAVLDYVRSSQVPVVILAARWSYYYDDDRGAGTAESRETFPRSLLSTVTALRAAGAEVWIMKDVPAQPFDVPRALALGELFRRDSARYALETDLYARQNAALDSVLAQAAGQGAHLLDPRPLLSGSHGRFALEREGRSLYCDSNHLSRFGALQLLPLFAPVADVLPGSATP